MAFSQPVMKDITPWLLCSCFSEKLIRCHFVLALGFSFLVLVKTLSWQLAPSEKLSRDCEQSNPGPCSQGIGHFQPETAGKCVGVLLPGSLCPQLHDCSHTRQFDDWDGGPAKEVVSPSKKRGCNHLQQARCRGDHCICVQLV